MNSSDYQANQSGKFTILVILIVIVVACFRNGTQRGANRKCLWSLLVPLLGWTVIGFFAAMFGSSAQRSEAAIAPIAGLVFMASVVVGIVFAILGLIETRREAAPIGRGFAWWSVLVCSLTGSLVIGGAIARSNQGAGFNPHDTAFDRIVNTNLNFTMQMPGRGWRRADPKYYMRDAAVVFTRRNPEMFAYLTAEKGNEDWTPERALDISKGFLRDGYTRPQLAEPKRLSLAGVDGYQYEFSGIYQGKEVFGVQWCGVKNGFIYQLGTRGYGQKAAIRDEAEQMLHRFAQYNPFQAAERFTASVAPFRSHGFHYSIDLSTEGWQVWPTVAQDLSGAEFGAEKTRKACLGIIPIYLYGKEVPLENLAAIILSRFELHLSDSAVHDIKTETNQIRFNFERTFEGRSFGYLGRVIVANGCALAEMGWWPTNSLSLSNDMVAAFAKLKIDPAPGLDLLVTKDSFGKSLGGLDTFKSEGQGLAYNQIGLEAARAQDWKNSLFWFEHAAELRRHDLAIAANVVYAYRRLADHASALAFLDRLDDSLKKQPRFQADRAWFESESGHIDDGLQRYASVFDGGFIQDEQFTYYARLLADKGDIKGSLARIDAYLKKHESLQVRLLYATLLSRDNRAKEAVAMLAPLQGRLPADAELAFSLAEAQLSAELYSEAIKTIDALAAKGINSGYTQLLKGRGHLGLKRYREARECFEIAAKLDPQNSQTTAYLDFVNGLLGQGNTYSIKRPIPPIKIPEKLLEKRFASSGRRADADGAYYTVYCLALEHHNGERRKRTTEFSVKIVDLSGVNLFSTLQIGFNPLNESVYVNEVKVSDEEGKTIATGNPDQYYVVDSTQGVMATGDRILNMPVPGLRPGAILSATISFEDLKKSDKPDFWQTLLSKTLPVNETLVYLCGDTQGMHVIAPAEVTEEAMPEGIVYRCANPLVLRVEPMQPPLWKTYPSLAVGSTEGSWKSEVVDYMARIRDKMTCDEKTRTFALEKTAGLKTDAEKVRALAEAVQKNVRYIAIEFGRRGIIPTSPGETLANGYGDCKDGATLLKALLGVCGIDSRLALVRPEGWIYKETPSLDQFTHVIVHVPSLNAFIDPSDKYLDPLAVTPLAMLSTEALALDAEHPDFIRGSMGSTGNKFEIERRVTVGASDIVVDEVVKMSGYAAGAFRGAFAAGPASNRKAEFEKFLFRQNGAVELREMKPENVEDVSKPLVLTSKFVIRRAGAKNSSQFKAVGSWEDYYLSPEPASDRKSSFERVAPVDVLCDLTVQGERDLNMTSAVQPAVSGKFGNGDSVVANENGRVHIRSSIHLNPGEFPAGEYGEYTGFMARLLDLVQPQIEVNGAGKL